MTPTIGDTAPDFDAETTAGRLASTTGSATWQQIIGLSVDPLDNHERPYIRIVSQPDLQPAGSRGA